jgi:hypothetical protein
MVFSVLAAYHDTWNQRFYWVEVNREATFLEDTLNFFILRWLSSGWFVFFWWSRFLWISHRHEFWLPIFWVAAEQKTIFVSQSRFFEKLTALDTWVWLDPVKMASSIIHLKLQMKKWIYLSEIYWSKISEVPVPGDDCSGICVDGATSPPHMFENWYEKETVVLTSHVELLLETRVSILH